MIAVTNRDESYEILEACFEVHEEMGTGFPAAVYQECLAIEFQLRGIQFVADQQVTVRYKGQPLGIQMRPHFVCYRKVIVEVRSTPSLDDDDRIAIRNFLQCADLDRGLLVNFGRRWDLEYERIVM
ncbi:MAG TPA: GxxExxY protein [Pirellulaceae bacterium]|nr:GxxExxY protein [Pirellulaceae bacterium]